MFSYVWYIDRVYIYALSYCNQPCLCFTDYEVDVCTAAKWREIGTHLGFLQEELDVIESTPELQMLGPKGFLSELLSKWLRSRRWERE